MRSRLTALAAIITLALLAGASCAGWPFGTEPQAHCVPQDSVQYGEGYLVLELCR